MDMNDPTAQGTFPQGAENSEPQQQANHDAQSGIQKRIDELTARAYEAERRATAALEQNAQLMQQFITSQQKPEEVPFEFDPEERQKYDYLIGQATKPLMQQVSQLEAQLRGSGVRQAAAQQGITDPAVLQQAEQLVAGWTQAGYFQKGIVTVENALDLALGSKYRAEAAKRGAGQQQVQQFNQFGGTPVQYGGAPPVQRPPARKELSHEEMEADPSAAIEFYNQRLANDS